MWRKLSQTLAKGDFDIQNADAWRRGMLSGNYLIMPNSWITKDDRENCEQAAVTSTAAAITA